MVSSRQSLCTRQIAHRRRRHAHWGWSLLYTQSVLVAPLGHYCCRMPSSDIVQFAISFSAGETPVRRLVATRGRSSGMGKCMEGQGHNTRLSTSVIIDSETRCEGWRVLMRLSHREIGHYVSLNPDSLHILPSHSDLLSARADPESPPKRQLYHRGGRWLA